MSVITFFLSVHFIGFLFNSVWLVLINLIEYLHINDCEEYVKISYYNNTFINILYPYTYSNNLNNIISKLDLMDLNRTLYLSFQDHKNIYKNWLILSNKASLKTFQRNHIIQITFSYHNITKLEINNKKST